MAVTQAQLTQLYLAYFGRPPDFDGIQFYTSNPAFTMTTVAAGFSASPESQALYGTVFGAAQINAIYQNLFNRDAEPAGLAYWSTEVNSGRITPAGAALAILQGAQNADKTSVDNKLAVATAFSGQLDTAAEIIGYSGALAAASARVFLHTVDATPESVTAANANLATAVAAAVAVGGPAGSTFNLTSTLDNVAGTAGNDVINAAPTSSGGTTLDGFDTIDGGGGSDTLNIFTATGGNKVQQGTVKNVEIVNIYNAGAQFGALIDASMFSGATQIWQRGANPSSVSNVSASTLLGFGNATGLATVATAAATATTLNMKLDAIGDGTNEGTITVIGTEGALTTLNLTGTLATSKSTMTLGLNASKTATSAFLNSAVAIDALTVMGTKLTTVDASGSAGGITFAAPATTLSTIKTGSGKDIVTITTATLVDNAATPEDDSVSAVLSTGAGNDTVTVNTTGTGATTVDAGAGDDTVTVTSTGTGKLTINLGDGSDTLIATSIAGTDSIDGGAGVDALTLNLVGASNVGAFSNFETFDAKALAHALDVDILATKNTVTEFITSGDVGGTASLTNIGAGVGFRATGDMGMVNSITLSQKAGGAMSVTADINQAAGVGAPQVRTVSAIATNATGLTADFSADFVDNVTMTMNLTGTAASTLAVNSGGTHATNVLAYHYGLASGAGVLKSVTVTGASALTLNIDDGAGDSVSSIASIDASAMTGGLTTDLANLKNGGSLSLGTGADMVTAGAASITTGAESIAGFEKAAASALDGSSTLAQADSDKLVLATGAVLNANANAAFTISNGVVKFTGAGPATLDAAILLVDTAAETAGEVAVFEYIGNTYVFQQGGTDTLVKLTGTTGVTTLVELATDGQYILG